MKQVGLAKLGLVLGTALWTACALADAVPAAGGIYTCTDASGRRITSDRPIATCVDREQRVLGNTGVELRRLGPTLTEQERTALEAKRRQEQAEQLQLREERSRERAMVLRYPNQGIHDAARSDALGQVGDVIAVALKHQQELKQRRAKLNVEMEFYQKDPKKAPANLIRQIKENDESLEEQQRYIALQELEKQRINQRFDTELLQLRKLWAAHRP